MCVLTEDWKKRRGKISDKDRKRERVENRERKKNRLCFTARLVGTEEEVGERQKTACVRRMVERWKRIKTGTRGEPKGNCT